LGEEETVNTGMEEKMQKVEGMNVGKLKILRRRPRSY
jgi:hypothetical protein